MYLESGSEERVGPDVGDLMKKRQNCGIILSCLRHLGNRLTIQNQLQKQLLIIAFDDVLNKSRDLGMFLGDRPPVVEESILAILELGASNNEKERN